MKVILLLVLTLSLGSKDYSYQKDNCSSLEVTYATRTEDTKATIEITARGGSEPYYYFFFNSKNNPLSWDFKKNSYTVDNSDYPKYVNVLDSKGCSKKIEIHEISNK